MHVHEVQNFLQHLINYLLSLADIGGLFEGIFDPVLVYAETRGPDDKGHGDKLARDLQRVRIAVDELVVPLPELQRLQNWTCQGTREARTRGGAPRGTHAGFGTARKRQSRRIRARGEVLRFAAA